MGGGSSSPKRREKASRSSSVSFWSRKSSVLYRFQACSIWAYSASLRRARSTPEISAPTAGVTGLIVSDMGFLLRRQERHFPEPTGTIPLYSVCFQENKTSCSRRNYRRIRIPMRPYIPLRRSLSLTQPRPADHSRLQKRRLVTCA